MSHRRSAFTVVELLVVVAIITLLIGLLSPALASSRRQCQQAQCLANMHSLGVSMGNYLCANNGHFWPYSSGGAYFWGKRQAATGRVDPSASVFMSYCGYRLEYLWCPSFPWGSYIPQGGVNEPSTTYGYNAWCLDPIIWGRRNSQGELLPRKQLWQLTSPGDLCVLADAAMFWSPGGVPILQNSTSLDPVDLDAWGPNSTPTTHFRHDGRASALCADGHAAAFDTSQGKMCLPQYNLGFVGVTNAPHYDNP